MPRKRIRQLSKKATFTVRRLFSFFSTTWNVLFLLLILERLLRSTESVLSLPRTVVADGAASPAEVCMYPLLQIDGSCVSHIKYEQTKANVFGPFAFLVHGNLRIVWELLKGASFAPNCDLPPAANNTEQYPQVTNLRLF